MFQLSKPGQYTPHLKYFNIANTETGLYLPSLSERAKNKEIFKNGTAGVEKYFFVPLWQALKSRQKRGGIIQPMAEEK